MVLSALELRTLIAGQIAACMATGMAPNANDAAIKAVAQTAVELAKAVEEATITSLGSELASTYTRTINTDSQGRALSPGRG